MPADQLRTKPKLLLFDVNETLLDLSEMKSRMNAAIGNEFAFTHWFTLMLQYSLVENVTNQYHSFGEIGQATFEMVEDIYGIRVPDQEAQELLGMIRQLPPHPDVEPGLTMLREAGFLLVALTNGADEALEQQMGAAGLAGYFDFLFSVDSVKKFKPAPDPYWYAANALGVKPSEAMLIAAHGWDITGALRAGLQAAFIARPGKTLYPLAPEPQLVGVSLVDLAEKLTRM
ncbi:haloacid dehalogenase type II [Telluribacter sp. SYSU D00476]|uniref:haloacid dehalogenase type II n=1 Tax=Telluribacter sp. SYSU D00476 TaxID=2811430 RepID=UPI001FF6EB0F|nr:haloacid dehalogenase type II [Telluribacter sp. SYSU D00476]